MTPLPEPLDQHFDREERQKKGNAIALQLQPERWTGNHRSLRLIATYQISGRAPDLDLSQSPQRSRLPAQDKLLLGEDGTWIVEFATH
jgi:hypothetical protein